MFEDIYDEMIVYMFLFDSGHYLPKCWNVRVDVRTMKMNDRGVKQCLNATGSRIDFWDVFSYILTLGEHLSLC